MTVFGITLTDYSGEALAALFVVLVFLGVWRPRSEVKMWQQQAERSADQVDKLLISVEPMVKFIGELKAEREVLLRQQRHTGEQPEHGGDPK